MLEHHYLVQVAHRGGSLLAPENTLAAFRQALTLPVDMVECDVQMTRDGRAIVFHDYTVDRLTDGTGNILDLSFADLRSLNAAAHFPGGWPQAEAIPTLREVLDLLYGRKQLCLEIKNSCRDGVYGRYPGIAETVIAELRAAGMTQHVLIISFDWHILSDIKRQAPEISLGLIVWREWWEAQETDQALTRLLEEAAELQCQWINADYTLFTPDLLKAVHQHHFKLGLWTVNTLAELQVLALAGVDALTTDRPDFFAHVR